MTAPAPALYFTRICHVRRAPVHHEFEYRSYSWYFDLDAPPRLPLPLRPLGYFRAADHLSGSGSDLRARVDAVLAEHEIDCAGGHVTGLMSARALGYGFDPLTVFWCHAPDGQLRCVIAEVHNTYGERHRYLVTPDPESVVAKQFYVSPFNPVAGRYRLRLPVPADRLRLAITLERPDGRTVFAATVVGRVLEAHRTTIARVLLVHPFETLRITALIRWQGLRLWARGLPIIPRDPFVLQETLP
ncbi:DUF1365 domain-containing protein [Nocardia sp. NPDC004722]